MDLHDFPLSALQILPLTGLDPREFGGKSCMCPLLEQLSRLVYTSIMRPTNIEKQAA